MHGLGKKIAAIGIVLGLTLGLVGCQPGQNTAGGTVVGAAAGGLLGAAIFSGNPWLGGIGGALLGGAIGNMIGQNMDRQDRANMQNAIVTTPVGQEASWTNTRTKTTYTVRPINNYRSNGEYCRRYETRVKIDGKWKKAYGRACRDNRGRWKIAS